MAQGQRIYSLTSANASVLSSITIDDAARAEIQNALNAGLEVTVHEAPITVSGWQGSGYSILDTEYGVGIYQITGGVSGGVFSGDSIDELLGWVTMVTEELLAVLGNAFLKAIVSLKASIERMQAYISIITNCDSMSSVAAIASISLVTEGLLILVAAAFAVNIFIGIIVAVYAGYLLNLMVSDAVARCEA